MGRTRKPHPVIAWLRTAGIAAELLGWGGLLLAGQFWFAVGAIYIGFCLLMLDAWFEPDLKKHLKWKLGIILILLVFAGIFSWVFVFVGAPLIFGVTVINADYPNGTKISGISFGPKFTEMRVNIHNASKRSYEDLNLLIKPTEPIAAISQITTVPNVSFSDANGMSTHVMDVRPSAGKTTAIPIKLLATDAGYRVRCPHLPAGDSIEVVIALGNVNNPPTPLTEDLASQKDLVVRVKMSDFSSYWYGHPDGEVYAPRPTVVQSIQIEGDYSAAFRSRSINQKIETAGIVQLLASPAK